MDSYICLVILLALLSQIHGQRHFRHNRPQPDFSILTSRLNNAEQNKTEEVPPPKPAISLGGGGFASRLRPSGFNGMENKIAAVFTKVAYKNETKKHYGDGGRLSMGTIISKVLKNPDAYKANDTKNITSSTSTTTTTTTTTTPQPPVRPLTPVHIIPADLGYSSTEFSPVSKKFTIQQERSSSPRTIIDEIEIEDKIEGNRETLEINEKKEKNGLRINMRLKEVSEGYGNMYEVKESVPGPQTATFHVEEIPEDLTPRSSSMEPEVILEPELNGFIPFKAPLPNWNTAIKEWGIAWELHVYPMGVLFLLLAVYCCFSLLKTASPMLLNRGYFLSLNILMVLISLNRSVTLLHDAYNLRYSYPPILSYLLLNLPFPSITSAFALLFLALLQVTRVQSIHPCLQNPRTVTGVIMMHFLLSLIINVIAGCTYNARVLLMVFEIITLVWALFLICAFFYCFRTLHESAVRTQNEMLKLTVTRLHIGGHPIPQKLPRPAFDLAVKVTLVMAVLSLLMVGTYIYGLVGVFHGTKTAVPAAWPWWCYQFALRVLEVLICYLITFVAGQPLRLYEMEAGKNSAKNGSISSLVSSCLAWWDCSGTRTWSCENSVSSRPTEISEEMYPPISSLNHTLRNYDLYMKKAGSDMLPMNQMQMHKSHSSYSQYQPPPTINNENMMNCPPQYHVRSTNGSMHRNHSTMKSSHNPCHSIQHLVHQFSNQGHIQPRSLPHEHRSYNCKVHTPQHVYESIDNTLRSHIQLDNSDVNSYYGVQSYPSSQGTQGTYDTAQPLYSSSCSSESAANSFDVLIKTENENSQSRVQHISEIPKCAPWYQDTYQVGGSTITSCGCGDNDPIPSNQTYSQPICNCVTCLQSQPHLQQPLMQQPQNPQHIQQNHFLGIASVSNQREGTMIQKQEDCNSGSEPRFCDSLDADDECDSQSTHKPVKDEAPSAKQVDSRRNRNSTGGSLSDMFLRLNVQSLNDMLNPNHQNKNGSKGFLQKLKGSDFSLNRFHGYNPLKADDSSLKKRSASDSDAYDEDSAFSSNELMSSPCSQENQSEFCAITVDDEVFPEQTWSSPQNWNNQQQFIHHSHTSSGTSPIV